MALKYRTSRFQITGAVNVFIMPLFVCTILISACSGPQEAEVLSPEISIPTEKVDSIVPDSSLHEVNVRDWNKATTEMRKSNCAAMILMAVDTTENSADKNLNELTELLFQCIDEVTYGMPTMNDNAIMQVSARCLYSMGYRLKSDSISLN